MKNIKEPKLDYNTTLSRFLLFSSLIVTETEDAYNNEFKYNLKHLSKGIVEIFDELLNKTYSNLKSGFGDTIYENFKKKYNKYFDILFYNYIELGDKYSKLVFIFIILEHDLNNLAGRDLADIPLLTLRIQRFNKELKNKYTESYNIFSDLVFNNTYNIKDKSYYDFYKFTNTLKII